MTEDQGRAVPGTVVVVIPAYDEARTIVEVIRNLRHHGFERLVVVDDGSGDATGELARAERVRVCRHIVNRGLGAALGTGIRAALDQGAEVIVTVDADGQHAPEDARRVLRPVLDGAADFVVGSRLMDARGMPWHRRVANRIANLLTFVLFGARTTDSQSGLRAFSRTAAEAIRIRTDGMEVSSEIVGEVARKRLRATEVPITSIYTEYSLSKGQSFLVGLVTLAKLILLKTSGRGR